MISSKSHRIAFITGFYLFIDLKSHESRCQAQKRFESSVYVGQTQAHSHSHTPAPAHTNAKDFSPHCDEYE